MTTPEKILQLLDDKVREGKGEYKFGITTGGQVGIWHFSQDDPVGIGDTASEAIEDAFKSKNY